MTSTVSVVDDDAAVRDSWSQLLAMHGYQVREYADAAVYLAEGASCPDSCLLLDIRMPGMNGMELQNELQRRGRAAPIVFVTGYGDVGLAVKAMKAGASNFLQKPCAEDELLEAIRQAVAPKQVRRGDGPDAAEKRSAIARLTHREREVLVHVSNGLTSKTIARRLGISVRTVDIHRANMMAKTNTRNVVELVRVAFAANLVPA